MLKQTTPSRKRWFCDDYEFVAYFLLTVILRVRLGVQFSDAAQVWENSEISSCNETIVMFAAFSTSSLNNFNYDLLLAQQSTSFSYDEQGGSNTSAQVLPLETTS